MPPQRDLTVIPDEAQVTLDLDFVLLNSYHSYCSQLTNLSACEKGVKWKRMQIDIKKDHNNLEPWYIELNPRGYVPTMLIQGNKPIVESSNIIQYMDDNFAGTQKLLHRDNEKFMTKYQEFYDCHDKWNVGAFTFGYFLSKNVLMQKGMPIVVTDTINKIIKLKEEYPSHADLYNGKIVFQVNRIKETVQDDTRVEAIKIIKDLLKIAERNLSEPGAEYVLGAEFGYTLADVFMTCVLTRAQTNIELFQKEVIQNPTIFKYWNLVKSRPSYAKAQLQPFNMPTHWQVLVRILMGLTLLSILMAAFVYWYTAYTISLWQPFMIIFASLFLLGFMAFSCKVRSANSRLGQIEQMIKSGHFGGIGDSTAAEGGESTTKSQLKKPLLDGLKVHKQSEDKKVI